MFKAMDKIDRALLIRKQNNGNNVAMSKNLK